MSYWKPIETAIKDAPIVVGSGLFACVAIWDGNGWWSNLHGRHVKATHWRKYVAFPWSSPWPHIKHKGC